VRELTPIPGVKFMDEPDQSVVACVEPAAEEEAPVVAAAPVEGAEAAAGAAGAAAAPAGDAAKPEATK
jgi:hypothetical protein